MKYADLKSEIASFRSQLENAKSDIDAAIDNMIQAELQISEPPIEDRRTEILRSIHAIQRASKVIAEMPAAMMNMRYHRMRRSYDFFDDRYRPEGQRKEDWG